MDGSTKGRAAAYLRVSSTLQAEANGTDAQRGAILAWAQAHGIEIPPERWYADNGISGKTMNRPGWGKLMRAVKDREVDTIVLYDLTRAGRTLKGLAEWIEEMTELGVRVVFVKDGLDISTAMGRLVAHVLSAVAEYQRYDIAERIRSGVRAKIDAGEGWGSSRLPVGSEGGPRNTPETYDALLKRHRRGETLTALAKEAGVSVSGLAKQFAKRK
jgi:DNA invertase Pin-like site-specific DNA recombinase